MSEVVEHALGVWLNQRHEDYLQDAGLGYSSIKDVYLSPVEWWNSSPYNPLRPPPKADTVAFKRGAALHTHVLDGPKVYEKVYGQAPTKESHPEFLDTVSELKDACRLLTLPTVGLKGELIERLLRANAPVKILSIERQRYLLSGKMDVSEEDDTRIRLLYRMMMRSRDELKLADQDSLTLKEALENALTEVSVYWVDEAGVRQRARFDILKPNFTGDLKSITQWKKSNFRGALLTEIIQRGYMIQAAHYHFGREALRVAVAEGRVFGGNKTQRKLLERISRADAWAWVFIFAKMDGAPQVRGIVIQPDSGQVAKAIQQREEALANFVYYRDFHGGLTVPWFDPDVVWEPQDNEWPQFSILGDAG